MAKTILGIDGGHDTLKLALVSGSQIKKTVIVPMPNNLIKDGRPVSPETYGELLRTVMKENGIKCNGAAIVLSNHAVFTKNIAVPRMNEKQLLVNIPYEFRDYITDELKNYIFDYAMISDPKNSGAENEEKKEGEDAESEDPSGAMQLLAVAAPVSFMDELRETCRKAGVRMLGAAPEISSYITLIRNMKDEYRPESGEYCILDLGYREVRMYMFKNDVSVATRVLEIGMSVLDDVIAEIYNVDVHLAHTYLTSNFENCQQREECVNTFNNIAIELMRAVNFYNFSNPDSRLSDIWLCGGGAVIPALESAVESTLDLRVHKAYELVGSEIEECESYVQAIGAALSISGR